MSILAKAVRDFLTAQTGFSTQLPGGLTPETSPQGGSEPYATYQGTTVTRNQLLDGTIIYAVERVQITVVAPTRSAAQAVKAWIINLIETHPGPQSVGSVLVSQWRVDDEQDQAEWYSDGSDDPARPTIFDIVGTFQGGQ